MGEVYKVIDRELNDQTLALKVLHKNLAADEQTFKRFRNEVFIARGLVHRNIVRIFDLGKAPEGYFYISMEYVEGAPLKDLTEEDLLGTVRHDGSVPRVVLEGAGRFHRFLALFEQLLDGVDYAHQAGVIHRDLKPANIFVTADDVIKLLDFGTARFVENNLGLTQTGQVIGTPLYMSPEQIRGEDVDARCDVYSLGLIGFEMMTGKRPFIADTAMAAMFHQLQVDLPRFASEELFIPEWFERIILKAGAKDREQRFADAGEMLRALRSARDGTAAAGEPVAKQTARSAAISESAVEDSYLSRTAPAIVSVGLCVLGGIWLWHQSGAGDASPTHIAQTSVLPEPSPKVTSGPRVTPEPASTARPSAQRTPTVEPTLNVKPTPAAAPSVAQSPRPISTPLSTPLPTPVVRPSQVSTAAPTAETIVLPDKASITISLRNSKSMSSGDEFALDAIKDLRWVAVLEGFKTKSTAAKVSAALRARIVDIRSDKVVASLPAALISEGLPGQDEVRVGGGFRSINEENFSPGNYKLLVEVDGIQSEQRFTLR